VARRAEAELPHPSGSRGAGARGRYGDRGPGVDRGAGRILLLLSRGATAWTQTRARGISFPFNRPHGTTQPLTPPVLGTHPSCGRCSWPCSCRYPSPWPSSWRSCGPSFAPSTRRHRPVMVRDRGAYTAQSAPARIPPGVRAGACAHLALDLRDLVLIQLAAEGVLVALRRHDRVLQQGAVSLSPCQSARRRP
jgi:hypothetical protein